jgi:hypothetical protein
MAKPYGDDVRRKFLLAYDQGAETLEEIADRFLVSVGWAKKIFAQRNRTGQAERVPHQPGRKWRASAEAQRQVMDWVATCIRHSYARSDYGSDVHLEMTVLSGDVESGFARCEANVVRGTDFIGLQISIPTSWLPTICKSSDEAWSSYTSKE